MNGQRFHQQKRIEMKTEQCERSLSKNSQQVNDDFEILEILTGITDGDTKSLKILWLYKRTENC